MSGGGDIRNLTTRFTGDASGFITAADQVKSMLTDLNKEYQSNRDAIKQNDKEMKNLEKTMSELSAEIKTSGDANGKLTAQYQQMGKELDVLQLKKAQLKTNEQDLKAKISLTTSELKKQNSELKDTSTQSEYTTKSLGNLGTALKALVFGYTGKKLFDSLIGSNAEMEQYVTNFKVMLGSVEEAEKLIKDITTMAAKTPFELPDLTKTANMLMGYGVGKDDIIQTMTQLGDLSAGNADKLNRISLAYGQMLAKGKVTGEELRQMTEAGVPLLNALADSLNVSTAELQDMISKGQVGIPELNKTIEALTSNGGKFSGMMSEQAQTMNGMISTLRDNMSQFGRDVGTDAFATVKDSIAEILSMVNEANSNGELKELANDIGSALGTVANAFVAVIKVGWEFKEVIVAGSTAMATYKVVTTAVVALESFKKAQNAATVAQAAFNAACNVNPYILLASALVGYTALLFAFIDNQTKAAQVVRDCNDAMKETTERSDENIANSELEIEKMKLKVEIYEELRQKLYRTAEEEEKLKQIASELQAVMPNGIQLIDQETGAYLNLSSAIGDVIEKKRAEMQLSKIESQYETAMENRETLKAEMDSAKSRAEHNPALWRDYGTAKSEYDKNEALIENLETEIRNAYSSPKEITAEEANSALSFLTGGKTTESSDNNMSAEDFESAYKKLKSNLNFDRITESEYYNSLEKLLSDMGVTEADEDYEKYFLEIYQGRKKASSILSSALKSQVSAEKKELDEFVKDSKSAYQENLNDRKDALNEYYKARKKLADEEYKLATEAIDNEISALEKATEEKIKLIDKETEAEKEKLQLKMDAIDEEIEARKRLQEDTDINREIDVVKAKLTYSQLDDFSREEFEKELQRLVKEKEETEWQRAKADEKSALSDELSSLDDDADARKEDLEAQLEAEKEAAEIRKASLEEHRDNLIATLEEEKEALISALDIEQKKMEQTFTYIGDNFNSLAELHANRIEDVFDVAVKRSKDAILELQSATNYASHLAEQIIADIRAAQSSSASSTTYNSSKSATNNFYSSGLTPSQVESIVADALGD
ncbi:MAG: tape measure protein [Oscillospiraceae bacterium]